jgi:hypothetical protein
LRASAISGTIVTFLTFGAAPASADWLVIPWRPAIDAIGNAEPPAIEGVAGLPDGVDFNPPRDHGRVVIDDSAPPPRVVLHLRRRKIWTIER